MHLISFYHIWIVIELFLISTVKHTYSGHIYNELTLLAKLFSFLVVFKHNLKQNRSSLSLHLTLKACFHVFFTLYFLSFSLPYSDTCTSPLSTRCGVRPSSLAARAVILQWLDWIPPHVITCLHFVCKASASKNSSFLICENSA